MNYQGKISSLNAEVCKPLKSSHHQNVDGHGTAHIKPIQKSQDHQQKELDNDILQGERINILKSRSIVCWSRSMSSVSEGWHPVPKE